MNIKIFARKIYKWFFERIIGKIFYRGRKDIFKPQGLITFVFHYISQKLNEKGYAIPWIYTKQECLDFWASIDNNSTSIGNRPKKYAEKSQSIVEFLHNFWIPQVKTEDSILELGCNCGANLYYLHALGYNNLLGIEINANAIEQMCKSFPSLKNIAKISKGSIEKVLLQMGTGSVDIIFTMAVAMHIHPHDKFLFKEMARVARKYICMIEPEMANSNYVFSRNYRRVFQEIGSAQIKSVLITKEAFPKVANYAGFAARLFLSGIIPIGLPR